MPAEGESQSPGLSHQDRQIRVFISSTFRDMQAERDRLVTVIFPQLRRLCQARGVTWEEVDLRWGVTDEAAAEGKILPVCLEEINRCRPYFIGLLGERYGWVPQNIPDELLEKEAWLREQFQEGKSVTELEILHGVLRNPSMAGHAFFYFRDRAYVPTESEQQQAHTRLADYFERQPAGPRRTDELPWQLAEARAWPRVRDLLADRIFFNEAWDRNHFEVKAYWTRIEAGSALRMVEAYHAQIEEPTAEADKNHLWRLDSLLSDTGHPNEALRLRSALAKHFRDTGDQDRLAATLDGSAWPTQSGCGCSGCGRCRLRVIRPWRRLGKRPVSFHQPRLG